MNNNPLEDPLKGVSDPLGKAFNLDDQCKYEFGANHISCRSVSLATCSLYIPILIEFSYKMNPLTPYIFSKNDSFYI